MRGKSMTLSEAKETLGVGDGYTLQEARSARKSLVKRYHPDINDDPKAEEILKRINEAYRTLVDSFDAEQERMRAKQAAEREQKRQAAERERAWKAEERRKAEEERRKAAAEEKRRRQAAEEERRRKAAERERAWKAEEERRKAAAREEVLRELERVRREAEQRKKIERQKLEQDYLKADEAATYAKTAAEHSKVAELFKALGSYRDSESRSAFHNAIAQEKLAEEKAKEQKLLRLNLLSTLTITVASATNAVLSFISGGIFRLILSTLYSGAVILSLSGLLELFVAMRGKMVYGKDGNLGQISIVYAVPLAIVAIVTRSPVWACIAVSQFTGGLSYMRSVNKGQSQIPKVILACISLASLVGAFGVLLNG